MRKVAGLLFLSLFAVPMIASAGSTATVQGLLVDTRCYGMSQDNVGNDHGGGVKKGCASGCAKMGIPVAVLKDGKKGGQLYTLASPAPLLADYMGMEARLTGKEVAPGVVVPKKLEVKDGSGWKEVPTTSMM